MLGTIAGDICGSPYEGGSCSPDRFELFGFETYFTDDTVCTVCTVAIAEALLVESSSRPHSRSGFVGIPVGGMVGSSIPGQHH